ncbi:MAG: S8 family serine peptidase [Anaerolineae bacterium]
MALALALLCFSLTPHSSLAQAPVEVTAVESALALEPTVRVVVALRPELAAQSDLIAQEQARIAAAAGPEELTVIQSYQNLPGLVGEVTLTGLEKLRQQPEVAAIALDLPVEATAMGANAVFIHADAVQRDYGLNGAGVNVAVLDTGVDTAHPDLAPRLIAQHCFNRTGGCPATDAAESDNAQDGNGHGTHVAGIIASQGQSSPQGIAPAVGLVAVRVLGSSGNGFSSDVLAGIDWIVTHQAQLQVKAINLSLGGGSYEQVCDGADANTMLYAAAVQAARQAGISLFAAAGNNGNPNALMAPACVSGVMAVGNVYDTALGQVSWPTCTDPNVAADQVACSSNSSPKLALLAPGVQVYSTSLGGGQTAKSGTSMSTPHATAVAVLLWQANPHLTPADVETILKETGTPITDTRTPDRVTPRLDALAAVSRVVTGEVEPISGTVLLQGRTDHSGVAIYLSDEPCSSSLTAEPVAATDTDGKFTINETTGNFICLQAAHPGYLIGLKEQPAGNLGTLTLPGGDVVADGVINILDLAKMALHYRTNEPSADVNADGIVDIFDLTIAASNYNLRGPVTDWEGVRSRE